MQLYITALQEGFIYGFLALGIFISLRLLNTPDLTTESSFGFGSAVAAVTAVAGHPLLSIPLAMLAGALAGFATGMLQTRLKVHPVLAGIITMSGLYSINLMVLGNTPNLSLGSNSLFKLLYGAFELSSLEKKIVGTAVSAIFCIMVVLMAIWFFKTHLGMCIRATGDNPDMVRASSINVDRTRITGLCISNALVALSGAMIAHYSGYSDIHSSNGTLVYGLAAVIIGETVFSRRGVSTGLISAIVGSVIYKLIVTFVVDMNLFGDYSATLMKLMCAIIVAVTLSIPAIKDYISRAKAKAEVRKQCSK